MDDQKNNVNSSGDKSQDTNGIERLGNFFARGTRPFLLIILFFSLYLAFSILKPFLSTIIFAIILAALAYPVHKRLVSTFRGKKNLAALTTVLLLTLVIVLPLFLVGSAMVSQGLDFVATVRKWIDAGGMDQLTDRSIIDRTLLWVDTNLPFVELRNIDFQSGLLALTQRLSEQFLKQGYEVVGNFASLVMRFMIMIFIAFYLVRDGGEMVKAVKHLSPLRERQEDRIFTKVRAVARSVLMGSMLTAALQGFAAAIGLAIVGVPAIFWGTMIAFSSLIPVIGTALFWVPITGYLVLTGAYTSAIFFGLWCAIVVGSIDNFVRPYLMRGEGGMSPFYVFLAIVGGIQVFGLAGLLYGPLIIGFAMVMLLIYEEEFREVLLETETDAGEGPEIIRALAPIDAVQGTPATETSDEENGQRTVDTPEHDSGSTGGCKAGG
ncbi:AI-2E family transporter [Oceanidesulfovibrio indonesiensis]|uniref:AI-2E family transporter n=1 Tax=Oceanidesulfovibrio indonesiensis TaxID=54767 RepID=A0A7M3MEN2_9BACT|nr:AI-2E family transporter [Oceanidesulfovibrio indonesiensis]TVM17344.1 AI-2E family transporter [Oceanidesulfovibrio indonesiensis]